MNWDIGTAARNGTLAHLCIDHQDLYNDTRTAAEKAAYARYSAELCTFNRRMEDCPDVLSVSVWLLACYNSGNVRENTRITPWYDPEHFRVTDKTAYDEYCGSLSSGLPLVHDFNVNSHLCIKNETSCFSGTDLLDFLKAEGKRHLLFTGGWLEMCYAQSVNDALKDDEISVGIVSDLTHASRYFRSGRLARQGYEGAVRQLCGDRPMITDSRHVLHSLNPVAA